VISDFCDTFVMHVVGRFDVGVGAGWEGRYDPMVAYADAIDCRTEDERENGKSEYARRVR
jgi:hypothetical protein